MSIFGLDWIPEAIKDLVTRIVELYNEIKLMFQGGKYAVDVIKSASDLFIPTAIMQGFTTLVCIAILYKILGREG